MHRWAQRILHRLAIDHNVMAGMYRRTDPPPEEYAKYLRRHGGFYEVGEGCRISPKAGLFDREYVRIGNNVWIEDCFIVGHDGTIGMLNHAYGVKLDKVGKVDIRDNVIIGVGASILPGVTIGPNAVVGPGSVVGRDVPPNTVVSGVPAVVVGTMDDYIADLRRDSAASSEPATGI